MSQFFSLPIPFSAILLLSIPLVLWGLLSLSIWLSFRMLKIQPPKLRFIIAVAFLQILLGLLAMYLVEVIKYEPFLIVAAGLGVIFLSDLLFIKMFLKNDWKGSLGTWAVASVMQLLFLPSCSALMLLTWFVFYFSTHPPQP